MTSSLKAEKRKAPRYGSNPQAKSQRLKDSQYVQKKLVMRARGNFSRLFLPLIVLALYPKSETWSQDSTCLAEKGRGKESFFGVCLCRMCLIAKYSLLFL
jgi:hypothetical protein